MSFARWWMGLLAIALGACARTPEGGGKSAASASTDPKPIEIEVSSKEAKVAGRAVADLAKAVRELLSAEPAPNLVLRATADAPQAPLMAVLGEAGRVDTKLTLELSSLHAESVQFQPSVCYIVAAFGPEGAKAWETRPSYGGPLTTITPWHLASAAEEANARRELQRAIQGGSCYVTLMIDAEASLLRALESWQRVSAGQELTTGIHVGLRNVLGTGDRALSGRLPPEVIQTLVRAHFGKFRTCYEKGLTKNDKLEGMVQVRFVIERDGTVSHVSAGDGSTLPEPEVRSCVLHAFEEIHFPNPEGGVVTVIYPIMLAPG